MLCRVPPQHRVLVTTLPCTTQRHVLCRHGEAESSTLRRELAEAVEGARRQEVMRRQEREQLRKELAVTGNLSTQLEESGKR